QSLERPRDAVGAVARVAVNLRDVAPDDVPRGTPVLTPGAWHPTTTLDVRTSSDPTELPGTVTLHLGTVAVEARLRPLDGDTARLTLPHPLPLVAGDRAILREPGGHRLLVGALVLDADPPALRRRGDGRRRGEALAGHTGVPDLATEVGRRGAMRRSHATALGLDVSVIQPDVLVEGDWLLDRSALGGWAAALGGAVRARAEAEALDPSLPVEAARAQAGIPDAALVPLVASMAGLEVRTGRVWLPGVAGSLGDAEEGLRAIEARLEEDPFAAPERPELEAAGLGPRQLAAAQRLGRVLRLPDDVVLLPSGPAQAMRRLAALPQPFTASDARRALGTTRRVVIPLLEHLDGRGWTRRVDGTLREVVRR
ncbi:MAG TPA: SelB C-terminal domain-containing protein, partial [Pedococcus sp.]|nr:SelB C-terminal domain-containing protein [Pedococcus sp.]